MSAACVAGSSETPRVRPIRSKLDGTIAAVIEWTARRVRKLKRAKHRGRA